MTLTDSSAVIARERTLDVYSASTNLCTRPLHGLCTVSDMADSVTTYALQLAKDRGWNQVEFANRISQTKQTVTMWLSRGMPPKHYSRVAALFGISVEQLTAGKPGNGHREPVQTIYGLKLTPEAAAFAAEWQGLRSPLKAQFMALVQTLLSEQARDDRQEAAQVDGPLLQRRKSA